MTEKDRIKKLEDLNGFVQDHMPWIRAAIKSACDLELCRAQKLYSRTDDEERISGIFKERDDNIAGLEGTLAGLEDLLAEVNGRVDPDDPEMSWLYEI